MLGPTGTVEYCREVEVSLLRSCIVPRTLDEHALAYAELVGGQVQVSSLRRSLARFVRNGWLLELDVDFSSGNDPDFEGGAASVIDRLLVPTSDRTQVLRRALMSYVQEFSRRARDVEVIVSDDSASPATVAANTSMMRDLSKSSGFTMRYASLPQRYEYSQLLAKVAEVPARVTNFCLLGDGSVTVGANRNCLILDSLESLVYFADDDTIATLRPVPNSAEGLVWSSQANPYELWSRDSRESAMSADSVNGDSAGSVDLLSIHERFLGRRVSRIYAQNWPRVMFSAEGQHPYGEFASLDPVILMSSFGSAGDCGWDNPEFYLFQNETSDLRLRASHTFPVTGPLNRDVVQGSMNIMIAPRAEPRFAMALGLDNRGGNLPPFPPTGRGEEVGFGSILSAVNAQAASVFLPWTIDHDPMAPRRFSDHGALDVSLGTWLSSCLEDVNLGSLGSPESRRIRIAEFLLYVGSMNSITFEHYVQQGGLRALERIGQSVDSRLAATDKSNTAFPKRLRDYLERARRQGTTSASTWWEHSAETIDQFQGHLYLYGQLLQWWPAILEGALDLQDRGVRLSRPL